MDVTSAAGLLPVEKIGDVKPREGASWLVEGLWLASACGIIGGQPKCCKSWLGLDLAVSVASDTPCLGRFAVKGAGPTLVFLAEDAVEAVRARVDGICKSRGLAVSSLDLSVVTSSALRLDEKADQERLTRTVEAMRPRLLLLDPLVRLHRLDENNAREISGLLGYLRELERRFQVAVVLTHHASKRGSSRPGQALRGSSDLHAFGDSNLYLARFGDDIELTVEHRSAPAIQPVRLRLEGLDRAPHLAPVAQAAAATGKQDLADRIIEHIHRAGGAVPRAGLRAALRVNNQRLGQALAALQAAGRVASSPAGLAIV